MNNQKKTMDVRKSCLLNRETKYWVEYFGFMKQNVYNYKQVRNQIKATIMSKYNLIICLISRSGRAFPSNLKEILKEYET